ncbi:MAG: dihydrolipoyl dehydrogenase [Proteobacteria bacterium]|nr:dihydrolipoyl dehydrogenase [Pseudomonadota bacterium]
MFDLAVIGAGPGGYVAAIRASRLGARVLLIERGELGGVCLNRGCIPTKSMIASSHALRTIRHAGEMGVALGGAAPAIEMKRVRERKDAIVEKLRAGIAQLIKSNGIELAKGEARIVGKGALSVDGRELAAKNILIATGSTWIEIPGLAPDGDRIVTTDEALDWTEVPATLLIVGGGVIGCEFGCMMRSFGAKVAVVEAMPSILPQVEGAISRVLARQMKSDGIEIIAGTTVESVDTSGGRVKARLSNGTEKTVDRVLVAVGRRPLTKGLGLEVAGIELVERGAIRVDARFETTCKGVYAIGDVIGGAMLAHAASAEGIAAVENIFGEGGSYDASTVPSPIFTWPEIGAVGLTSEELKARGTEFLTGRFPYSASGKAMCDGEPDGQAIVHTDMDGRILGAHIIGRDATLLVPEAALAMRKGMSVVDLEKTIHAHPTLSEVVAEAAADVFGRAIHKARRV